MEEVSRDDFIRLMVEQLQLNESSEQARKSSLAKLVSESPHQLTRKEQVDLESAAKECFRLLSFDFPQVEEEQVVALDSVLRDRLKRKGELPDWFALRPKVFEGVQYLLFERQGTCKGLQRALSCLNVTIKLKILEYLIDDHFAKVEKTRSSPEALLGLMEQMSYQPFSLLDCEAWEGSHVNATIYRVVRTVLAITPDDVQKMFPGLGVEKEAWVSSAKATWPRFLFVLRDRLTDKPESMGAVLPALMDLAVMCHKHAMESASIPASMSGNSMVVAVLGSIASSKTLEKSGPSERGFFWDLIHQQIVPEAGKEVDRLVFRRNGIVADSTVLGPAEEEHFGNLLVLLGFYSKGDPRRPFSSKEASNALSRNGVIRSVAHAWVHGSPAMPHLFPAPDSLTTLARLEGQDRRAQQFLFLSALRSPDNCMFLVKVPGFFARITSKVSRMDQLAWSLMIACVLGTKLCHRREEAFCSGTPGSLADLEAFTEKNLLGLGEPPLDKDRLKFVVDFLEAVNHPELVQHVHYSPIKDMLISALKSTMKHASSVATASSCSGENPQMHETPDSKAEEEHLLQDRAIRLRHHVKRFLCQIEGQGNKAD